MDDRFGGTTPRAAFLARAGALAAAGSAAMLPLRARADVPSNASLATLLAAPAWLNGAPSRASLRGNVVLVDVFTVECINCRNITPNLRALNRTKRSDGLVVLGIHTPETEYERGRDAVASNLKMLGVTWPVAVDNERVLWNAYRIEFWPTQLIFDRAGTLRKVVAGDSQDALVNATIDALLKERA